MQVEQMPLSTGASVPVRYVSPSSHEGLSQLLRDFYESTKSNAFWLYSAWLEVLLNYRSTVLGPLWIMIGTGVFVFAIGNLYGRVVLSGDSNVYLVHLAVGIALWYLMIQCVVKSCSLFSANGNTLLDGAVTYTDLLLKLVTINLIYLLHNAVIVVLAFIALRMMPSPTALVILLTVPLVLANILWLCVILAILGARYADLE